jgi:hypothetical protein
MFMKDYGPDFATLSRHWILKREYAPFIASFISKADFRVASTYDDSTSM